MQETKNIVTFALSRFIPKLISVSKSAFSSKEV